MKSCRQIAAADYGKPHGFLFFSLLFMSLLNAGIFLPGAGPAPAICTALPLGLKSEALNLPQTGGT